MTEIIDGPGTLDAPLTPDNPLLSRLTIEVPDARQEAISSSAGQSDGTASCASDCTSGLQSKVDAAGEFAHVCNSGVNHIVASYVQAGIAPATRRVYRADLDHFRAWGGGIPATDAQVAAYLAEHATELKAATLTRRLATISVAHEAHGLPNPVRSPLARATMRGIRRERGSAQRQAKPLLRDDLFAVLEAMGESLKDIRDRALLLIGFAGGFRRSELIAINCTDIEHVRQGIIITLRRSKTDQDGVGRKIGVPHGRSKWCPVVALEQWHSAACIAEGAIFRRVDRHGRVLAEPLSAEAVCLVVRERVAGAGFDPRGYSGHSLRAGFATSAAQAGVSILKIKSQTGHVSDAMLARYIRDGELFKDNAAGSLL